MRLTVDAARAELLKIDTLIDRNVSLPGVIFRRHPHSFRIIDFDEMWSADFFRRVARITKADGDESFTLAVLQPDPESYYYSHFRKYPFFTFTVHDTEQSYVNAINEDPGD